MSYARSLNEIDKNAKEHMWAIILVITSPSITQVNVTFFLVNQVY